MNCGDCQELLVEYSLGELSGADAQRVAAHLTSPCADCQQELDELQESLGMLGESLESVPPPPAIKEQLLTRIAAEKRSIGADSKVRRAVVSPSSQAAVDRRWQRVFAYAATLLCGFLIGALAVRQLSRGSAAVIDRDAQLAEILESARENFGSPEVRFAALHRGEDESAVVGHMMWDARGRNLHVFAFDVAPPAADHQLAVWFVPENGPPIYAGELPVSSSGGCSAVFQSPGLEERVRQVVVTEEPAGQVAQPSGPERIVSRLK